MHTNMQPFMKLFLTVLLAHLLGDFPLQSSRMVRGKRQGIHAYLVHGAIHLLVLVLCVAAFIGLELVASLWFWIARWEQIVGWNAGILQPTATGQRPPSWELWT